ncbi:unnamed protein product [Ambrosiozyma monospora]|uniref:Unnamed protein product n=1 Tax=Ambrosiozyma monospora TaxID=43982 RepID=A0A9W7DJD2_AMBMO|nr:unnamed protein product [Ambrosiozyma monospora]
MEEYHFQGNVINPYTDYYNQVDEQQIIGSSIPALPVRRITDDKIPVLKRNHEQFEEEVQLKRRLSRSNSQSDFIASSSEPPAIFPMPAPIRTRSMSITSGTESVLQRRLSSSYGARQKQFEDVLEKQRIKSERRRSFSGLSLTSGSRNMSRSMTDQTTNTQYQQQFQQQEQDHQQHFPEHEFQQPNEQHNDESDDANNSPPVSTAPTGRRRRKSFSEFGRSVLRKVASFGSLSAFRPRYQQEQIQSAENECAVDDDDDDDDVENDNDSISIRPLTLPFDTPTTPSASPVPSILHLNIDDQRKLRTQLYKDSINYKSCDPLRSLSSAADIANGMSSVNHHQAQPSAPPSSPIRKPITPPPEDGQHENDDVQEENLDNDETSAKLVSPTPGLSHPSTLHQIQSNYAN